MNNNKKINPFVQPIFFIFLITFLQNSFGENGNNVIKITDTKPNSVNLKFKNPGDQTLTIENHLAKDVSLNNVFFIGEELTAPLIAQGISMQGYNECSLIKSGTSCSFVINAAKNTSPSINSNGAQLLLNYTIAGEKENKFFPFGIKIDFNKDIKFEVKEIKTDSNLSFNNECYNIHKRGTMLNDYSHCQKKLPETKKIILLNNNPLYSLNITNVRLVHDGVDIKIKDYSNCLNLKNGDSCEIATITTNADTNNNIIPIYVTYDVVDKNNVVIKKDLITVAAATIEDSEVQITKAILRGIVTFATVKSIYNNYIMQFTNSVFVTAIGNNNAAALAKSSALGVLSGVAFWIMPSAIKDTIKYLSNTDIEKYDHSIEINKLLKTATVGATLGTVSCWNYRMFAFGGCMILSITSGLLSALNAEYFSETYSETFPQPVEKTLSATITASTRVICRCGIPYHGGATEVWQEVLSEVTQNALSDENNSKKYFNDTLKNSIAITDRECEHKECICANLPN